MPAEQEQLEKKTRSRGRERARRPNGDFYSSDPSERMKQLHEDGKAGGQFGKLGGRPRKPTVSEAYAQVAEENVERIRQAVADGLDPEKSSVKTRIATAEVLRKEEEEQRKREERESERAERRGRDFLMDRLTQILMSDGPAGEEFRARLAAVDVEHEEITDDKQLDAA